MGIDALETAKGKRNPGQTFSLLRIRLHPGRTMWDVQVLNTGEICGKTRGDGSTSWKVSATGLLT
ncbi:MAG TPA: hypothetical protein HPP41_03495 [Deltaproteobacteria bacterium]|nr:hypothetical protein [Deltaproteobacteria bacterium]